MIDLKENNHTSYISYCIVCIDAGQCYGKLMDS